MRESNTRLGAANGTNERSTGVVTALLVAPGPLPEALWATTPNVYTTPRLNPDTVNDVAFGPASTLGPMGDGVIV